MSSPLARLVPIAGHPLPVLALALPPWTWQPVAGLAMAAMTAAVVASRLALRRHALHDVAAGTATGAAMGWPAATETAAR